MLDLLQVCSEVLIIWQDSDCWFSNQWHGSQRNTHRGILRLMGSSWVPSSSASLRQMVKQHPENDRLKIHLHHHGLPNLPKQVGGWIHTSLSLSTKARNNEVGNLCPTFLRKKKNWQYIVHDIRGYSPGFQSHPIKSCLVSRDSQYLENRGYLSTCSSHKSTEWRITGVLRVPQMARQKRS